MESKSFTVKSLSPLALTRFNVSTISARRLSWTCRLLASSQRANVSYETGSDGMSVEMVGRTDRFGRGFVACEHNRPGSPMKRGYYSSHILSHRTWGTISSSFSRQSGRRAEFALTEGAKVVPSAVLYKEMKDEPSKLRRSFREVPSFISCLFSSISLAATSCTYALFSRRFNIPGLLFLLESQVLDPFGAHLRQSIVNMRSLEGTPNTPKLLKANVTMGLVLKWKGSVHQVLIRLGELVVCVFQSAKVIVKGTCTDAGFGSVDASVNALDFTTYASSVAFPSQEYTLITAACPEPVAEITSCHLSASYRKTESRVRISVVTCGWGND